MVNKGSKDRDLTIDACRKNIAIIESTVNVTTLERCLNDIVHTVEDRMHNASFTPIESIVAPKNELSIRSINESSGRDVSSVTANSERGEPVGINASFENASGNNNILPVSNVNDETRHDIPDEVSELSCPETRFDRHTHTHHMVTAQTTQTNQIPGFLTGRILTPCNPPSHQQQNLSTQISQDNNLPMVEQTPRNQNSDANNSIFRLVDAIAGISTQQRPQAATILKPVSTFTLIFDGKNEKIELFEDLFHTMLRMQP